MIVYDYMPNLSLLSHLHGQFASEHHLNWKRRLNIAVGSAQGLFYLHHQVNPHIIHRDIKASNVLLNSDFEPLVADFGFAKLIPEGVSHLTTRVKGTLGYLAPEYAMWGKVSESCDVYSFGILLLELVSGRKPIEKLPGGVKRTITEWADPFISKGKYGDMVDRRLKGNFDEAQVRQMVHVAALCVQTDAEKRPNMKQVVNLLKGFDADEQGITKTKMDSIRYDDQLLRLDQNTDDDEDDDDNEAYGRYGVFSALEARKIHHGS